MIPYLLSAGVHLLRDLTAAREDLARRHQGVEFLLGSALGPHPLLEALVATRVSELEKCHADQVSSSGPEARGRGASRNRDSANDGSERS